MSKTLNSKREELENLKETMNSNYDDLYKKAKLYSPISNIDEKWKLVPTFLKIRGLVKQHIDSFNYFTDIDIKNIVRSSRNYMIKSEINPNFYLKYKDIRIGFPQIEEEFSTKVITPHECRLRSLTYSAPIFVDVAYTLNGYSEKIRKDIYIGRMPIMLGSNHCILKGKNFKELSSLHECPYDPRGYFIVKGVEKVILIHEQMSQNRIIVEYDNKGNLTSNVTSSTHDTKTRTSIIYKNGKFYVKHNSFSDDINVIIIFKAMNILSDLEIIMLIGDNYKEFIIESIAECNQLNIFTRADALNFLSKKIKTFHKNNDIQITIETISSILIAHVHVIHGNYHAKALYLSLMIKRLISAINDNNAIDDKDYYGNKRLELAGQLISLLFEDLFKKYNNDLKKIIDMNLLKNSTSNDNFEGFENFDIFTSMRSDIITHGLQNSISTGNWVVKRFKMRRSGITQVLSRMSYIAALGMMTRINSQFEKTRKISGPRALQPSQWGMVCPSDTPEGESCGLVKNLALLSHVTTDQKEKNIINLCINLGVEDISMSSVFEEEKKGDEDSSSNNYLVYVNGSPIGITSSPKIFCDNFRKLRRKGKIHEFVSISCNHNNQSIAIACDGGRLTRPYIRIENEKILVTKEDLKLLEEGKITFNSLVKEGKIEYLDVNEENDVLIALKEEEIKKNSTHLEIAPFTILGVVAGLIPYPHHNQSPRNTYQCAMGKQAIGTIGYNQLIRADTLLYLMIYPQRPLVKTITIELSNYEKLPAGQNASVAVMSYSGYDIEDAVILNKASLDRGFARIMTLRRYESELEKYPNGTQDIRKAPENYNQTTLNSNIEKSNDPNMINTKTILPSNKNNRKYFKNLHALDKDGLPFIGSKLTNGDLFLNKYIPENTRDILSSNSNISYIKQPLIYKGPIPSYVDRVILTSSPEVPELIKIMLRQTRRPELGDKFSSRHGQKGVCGMIVPQEDMPFNETGWCPDLIMNPHGFPSRMTVGKLIELIGGKSAVLDGKFKYGTAFAGDKIEDIGNILIANGYSYSGKDILYSGITGEPLNCFVFSGPIFYQRLKHMVVDKMHARSRGPRAMLTRQPLEGRSKEGGLRIGEMEKDCVIGYGASCLLLERLMISSDLFTAHICAKCGYLGMEGYCQFCRDGTNIGKVKLPYAFKLLTQELMSMNIKVKFKLSNI